jgi:hypothetical protein
MDNDPGIVAAKVASDFAGLAFVPIASQFELFPLLVEAGHGTPTELLQQHQQKWEQSGKGVSPLNLPLLQDVLYIMAGIGFVTKGDNETYTPNTMTQHLVTHPSALCGLLQGAIEAMTAAAFLNRKLKATNYQYPFKEGETPLQYAYESMGKTDLAKSDFFGIMAQEGRMPSFNTFMEGKWGIKAEPTFPALAKMCNYDLAGQLASGSGEYTLVDVGGGRGHRLQDVLKAFPDIKPKSLVLQEYSIADVTPEVQEQLTVMAWNFKTSPQPVENAAMYFISWIFHNLTDLAAEELLKKIAAAMGPHSRLMIVEPVKNVNAGNLHAIMILILGGRERSSEEWKVLAGRCGLEVSFEVYPPFGEGMVEMKRVEAK